MNVGLKWRITICVLFVLVVGGYFAATRFLDHLVNDGKLCQLISRKTAVKLSADCGFLPLAWRGMSIRSDGIVARGKPPHSLRELSATNIRAHCSLQNLWRRKWTISVLEASHLQAAFGEADRKSTRLNSSH